MEVLRTWVKSMVSKTDIRRQALSLRHALSDEEKITKSKCICERIVSHPLFLEADTVFCYMDYRDEVQTRPIIEAAWRYGKVVAVPKTDDMTMSFYEIRNFSELRAGYKGILEPTTLIKNDSEEGLLIMPGVAFDFERNRVGYGKGYYDRYLNSHKKLNTMALAYSVQVFSQIPWDEHDIKPDFLITEEQIYV